MLFSHDEVRDSQKELIDAVNVALNEKRHVLAHAPTGLGKTAAALCPALEHAQNKDLVILFLTSRHTQQKIVLDTVRKVNERNGTSFSAVSLIGKKQMCGQDVEGLQSSDFSEFCKSLVEKDACEFYTNARGKNNLKAKQVVAELKVLNAPAEVVISDAVQARCCPYEISLMLAEEAKVIVADYYYVFHPRIRDALFAKIKKKLEQCILIVDEAHNVPSRMRDVMTFRLSNRVMRYAIQEAKKHDLEVLSLLVEIQDILNKLSDSLKADGERMVKSDDFLLPLEKIKPFDELVEELAVAAEMVRDTEKVSHVGSVAKFVESWGKGSDGFARVIKREKDIITLSVRCLDPSMVTKEVFDSCYASVMMSGTLSPLPMYADVLGVPAPIMKAFKSPFDEKNRLPLIVPKTTTKFSLRNDAQYREIAKVVGGIASKIPGCVMIFFPSYFVRDRVAESFVDLYKRPLFFEKPGLSKEDKQNMLNNFSKESKSGAALLAVAAGSFGEGVDLPGILKGVIVVGLPLDRPDVETTELISYYDKKFGKGWEYGYILPAMTKCIQNAGRCIRTETDRGVIVFVDERYAWERYKSCFPPDWNIQVSQNYEEEIARFFGKLF